ncbi:MAG: oxidoreductase [Eggerthellaceae bacterium]|nr:oxidoreductase [Eggerthellaceae bacterium]
MKVFVFDSELCNGCYNCHLACKDEHSGNDWSPIAKPQQDTGMFWLNLKQVERGQVPRVKVSNIAHLCQHCDNAPCIEAAPDAVYRREDGLVIIDPEKAKGNRALVDACPYGAISWNVELELPQKCTGCAHLLDDGWTEPRCVDACALKALRFGDAEDFAEEIARSEELRPELGSGPHVYYLNLPKRFIGGTLVDFEADEVVIGATVTLQQEGSEDVLTTTTDEFGDFWFKQIEPARYRLYFQADDYLTRYLDVSTVDEDKSVGDVELFAAPAA